MAKPIGTKTSRRYNTRSGGARSPKPLETGCAVKTVRKSGQKLSQKGSAKPVAKSAQKLPQKGSAKSIARSDQKLSEKGSAKLVAKSGQKSSTDQKAIVIPIEISHSLDAKHRVYNVVIDSTDGRVPVKVIKKVTRGRLTTQTK